MIQSEQPGPERGLGRRLNPDIHRGLNLQTLVVEPVDAIGLLEMLAHVLGEERTDLRLAGMPRHRERTGDRLAIVGLRDEALREHAIEHVVAPRHDLVGVAVRAELARALDDPGERRGLGKRQVAHAVAEIGARRALHAVVAMAEEDDVQVHREDLLLGELLLELDGEERLRDLAPPALLVGQEELAGELHGDRGGALRVAAAAEIHQHGADDAERVDTAVMEEVRVLGREQGIAQERRNLTLIQHQAPLARIGGERDFAVAIVDLGDELRAEARDRFDARNVNGGCDAHSDGDAADHGGEELQAPTAPAGPHPRAGGSRSFHRRA